MIKEELFEKLKIALIKYEQSQGEFCAVGCGISLYADDTYTWCGHDFFINPIDECNECKEL